MVTDGLLKARGRRLNALIIMAIYSRADKALYHSARQVVQLMLTSGVPVQKTKGDLMRPTNPRSTLALEPVLNADHLLLHKNRSSTVSGYPESCSPVRISQS
jgi:hypothetical protein